MYELDHIVVLIDSEEDNQTALTKAERLAETSKARITLFSSGYNSALDHASSLTSEQRNDARNRYIEGIRSSLMEKAQDLKDKGFKVDCLAIWDKHPSQAIIHYLEQNPTHLVIKTTHHQNVMQRTFFSHTDWDLIRYSPVPVLLAKALAWPEKIKITVAVDPVNTLDKPDNLDEVLIHYAEAISNKLKGKLGVLHVYDPTPLLVYLDQPALDAGDISDHIRQQHSDALNELVSRFPKIKPDAVHLETGSPSTVIPDHLYQNDSQIVVMGSTSRHGLDRLLIGHTAERILDRISADILVVRLAEVGE